LAKPPSGNEEIDISALSMPDPGFSARENLVTHIQTEAEMERRTFLSSIAGMGAVYAMNIADPAQYIPSKASKEKWAVLFGTWCGTARDAGIWISEGMGGIADVYDVRQKPDLKSYDHLVIGTAIHGGKGPKELEEYIKNSGADLKSKIRAYYAVCGNGGDRPNQQTQTNYIDNYLAKLCGTTAAANRVFPGRITKALLSEADYKQLEPFFKSLGQPFDDYDHLSRWDCMAFGRTILAGRSAPAKKQ
jgi:menaquinone-dependent protoporphyrinogen IX oxidase